MTSNAGAWRCALLFGLPVTRDEFDRCAAEFEASDYLIGMLQDRSPAEVWRDDYGQVAAAAQELITVARGLGVAVYTCATLADVTQASERSDCVVLLAHWRGVMFRPSDLKAGAPEVVARLRHARLLGGQALTAATGPAQLADVLNAAIADLVPLSLLNPALVEGGRKTPAVGQALCRDVIDEVLDGMVVPGNRIELFDGLHTPGAFEQSISPHFRGEIDLAMCNSAAVATVLDLRRGDRTHHLHWPDYVLPIPQMLMIGEALRRMSTHGGGYIANRMFLAHAKL